MHLRGARRLRLGYDGGRRDPGLRRWARRLSGGLLAGAVFAHRHPGCNCAPGPPIFTHLRLGRCSGDFELVGHRSRPRGSMVERGLGGIVGRAPSLAASRFALYHPG